MTNLIIPAQNICTEFIKGFSVLHENDESAKQFMEILFERFQFLEQRINMYHILVKMTYYEDACIMIDRILKTFEKMLSIIETDISNESNQQKNVQQNSIQNIEI